MSPEKTAQNEGQDEDNSHRDEAQGTEPHCKKEDKADPSLLAMVLAKLDEIQAFTKKQGEELELLKKAQAESASQRQKDSTSQDAGGTDMRLLGERPRQLSEQPSNPPPPLEQRGRADSEHDQMTTDGE